MAYPELDLRAAGFWQNPFPVVNDLRERTRVAVSNDGIKVILRHADVGELLLSGKFINEGISLLARRGFKPGDAMYEYRRQAIGALSGDAHRRVRNLVGKALSVHQVDYVRATVERRLPGMLEPLLGNDINVLETLTHVPLLVIGEYLGIAEQDRKRVDALIHEGQAKAFGREVTPAVVGRANEIFSELMAFVTEMIEQRKLAPHNDMLARLLDVEEEQQTLTQMEVIVLFLNLLIGATESTASSISTGILLLARQPELLDALRANPALMSMFVEENLRLYPPNTLLANKIAAEDLEFCGAPFAKGETVMVPIPSPNRDPRVFPNPDQVDLLRKPERHFTFSLGSHFCLGQALARVQLTAFFSILTRTVRRVELLEERIEWEPFAAVTSMKSLRVRLTP
jgi:cytochrome P450